MEPPAIRRKRARPVGLPGRSQLREDVVALIRSTRAPLEAQRRGVEEAYDAAWRAFCQCRRTEDREHVDDAARRRLASTLRELSNAMAEGGLAMRETVVRRLARSVVVSRGNVRLQRLALEWTWLGHSSSESPRLWRLDEVVQTIALDTAGTSESESPSHASEWLRVAICSLRESSTARHDEEPGLSFGNATCRQVVSFLVQVAFVDHSGESYGDIIEPSPFLLSALALDALITLVSDVLHNLKHFELVCEVIAAAIRRYQHFEDVAATLRRFLRLISKRFLDAIVSGVGPEHSIQTEEDSAVSSAILALIQSSISPIELVMLFRQVWEDIRPTEEDDPFERLGGLIAECAQRDQAFQAHALATAHDLAHDAISDSNAVALRHSLELAAAATTEPIDDHGNQLGTGYLNWFKGHFGVPDSFALSSSPDNSRLSISSITAEGTPSQICLRALVSASSSSGSTTSTSGLSKCGLVSTKRHVQFICAFLLEFDRSHSPRWKAHHILAHLSALKTHQAASGSALAGLLTDFSAQMRALHAKLHSKEQEVIARERHRRLSSMSAIKSASGSFAPPTQFIPGVSQYSAATHSLVEELLELHFKDVSAVMSKVNQLKMFNGLVWKREVLPCCLDIEYWQRPALPSQGDAQDHCDVGRLPCVVGLVQTLAKHHVVGNDLYGEFLERVERLILSIRPQNGASQPKEQSVCPPSGRLLVLLEQAIDVNLKVLMTEGETHVQLLQSVDSVGHAFIAAFDGLLHLQGDNQLSQIRSVHALIVGRYVHEVSAATISLDRVVEFHLKLWTALLSSVTHEDASPQQRLQSMEAYCRFAAEILNTAVGSLDDLVTTTLYGVLLGLLASVSASETLARSSSLQFCAKLALSSGCDSADHLVKPLRLACSYLTGLLVGFSKSCSSGAPQLVFQSLLTPQLRDCLVWVSHHSRFWWKSAMRVNPEISRTWKESNWWSFVGQAIHDVYEGYGWFRLTFSPGVLASKDRWQVFLAMEFTCCAIDILDNDADLEIVDFINRQREQLDMLLLQSANGQSAGVRVTDICIWIAQAVLELAASSSCSNSALDVFVLLLKDTWVIRDSAQPNSPSDALGFSIELAIQLCQKSSKPHKRIIQYAIRCVKAILDGLTYTNSSIDVQPAIIRQFLNLVGLAIPPQESLFEWTSVLWCIVGKLAQTGDLYSTMSEIPSSVFARWAYDFPRLCRLLKPKKNGKGTQFTSPSLLQAVQRCFEFYRTLNIRGLGPPPSLSLLGVSASQYVPTSADDDSLGLHVRAIEWLVASNLLPIQPLAKIIDGLPLLDFETSLTFHDDASRVLSALLEDVSIGRPEDVAAELTEICQACWLMNVSTPHGSWSNFKYQLILVHMVAELTSRHASVGRFLLRSSSELLNNPQRSLFLTLVLATSSEIEKLDDLLRLNGSLWVNTFAEVACSLMEIEKKLDDTQGGPLPGLLQHTVAFENLLNSVLSRVLKFAAAKQIDLLDAAVIGRVEKLFPALRDVLAQVPVLNLASAALEDW